VHVGHPVRPRERRRRVSAGTAVEYEVELTVDRSVADAVAAWLPAHIEQVLSCDGFLSAEWRDVDAGADAVRWCIRYSLRDCAVLDAYLAGPAAALRADGLARFGDRMSAARRVSTPRRTWRSQLGD